ncbi:universal stress protein [Oerskovia enterophila]|uniref:universal stress protein n=1 Tax=Oerskovia enterophila TaxID=43678 RepID=UPI0037F5B209
MRDVVVGVDGSVQSQEALDWALVEAGSRGVPLTAVLAWEPSWQDGPRPSEPSDFSHLADLKQEQVLTLLDEARHRTGVETITHAEQVQGSPAAALLARAEHAEMLVVGRRGLGRLGRLVLGSVSSAVVQGAVQVPVTVVRSNEEDEAPETDGSVPRVVVGVDGSRTSVHALRHGLEVARRTGAVLDAVFCWQIVTLAPLPDSWGWTPPIDDYEKFAGEQLDRALESAGADLPEDQLRRSVVHAQPAKGLIDAARGAERLVVGNRGTGGFDRLLLGSVSRQAVEYASCPVTVVRRPAEES